MSGSSTSPLSIYATVAVVAVLVLLATIWWQRPEPRTIVIWIVTMIGGLVVGGSLLVKFQRDQQQVERLTREGIRGVAHVLRVDPTNVLINRRPQVQLQLRVELPGRAPYEITHVTVLPLAGHGAAAGRAVLVQVDPADPQNMLFDWAAPPPDTPKSPDTPKADVAERLRKLEALRAQNLISAEEYEQQRQRLLSEL